MQIEGQTAIVTGGASGLGGATAEMLARAGAKVAIFDLNAEAGEAKAKELGGAFFKVNVTDESEVEEAIAKVVALAVLMPIVASMGGIAGSQTLTLVIRGMAVGQISGANVKWLLNREFLSGILNGMLWAVVVAGAAMLWFQDLLIGAIIAAALVINLVAAALVGTVLPLFLKSRNIDPALAGSVILTTVTDVVGFMAFLGLATIFYA